MTIQLIQMRYWTYLHKTAIKTIFLSTVALGGCAYNAVQTKEPIDSGVTNSTITTNNAVAELAVKSRNQASSNSASSRQTSAKSTQTPKAKPSKQRKKSQPLATTRSTPFYAPIVLGQPFKIKYGQKRALPNSDFTFKISKIQDSRCPMEMSCVQPGNASLNVEISREGRRIELISIFIDEPIAQDASASFENYDFKILELLPYPTVHIADLQHYVAKLVVEKIE
ncbi:hypothetical protein [Kaarinaea lacus]